MQHSKHIKKLTNQINAGVTSAELELRRELAKVIDPNTALKVSTAGLLYLADVWVGVEKLNAAAK